MTSRLARKRRPESHLKKVRLEILERSRALTCLDRYDIIITMGNIYVISLGPVL